MRLNNSKHTICLLIAILLKIIGFSQSNDSIKYVLIDKGSILTACSDVIEKDSTYYVFTDNINEDHLHFSSINIFDNNLNFIKEKQLWVDSNKMLVKILPKDNYYWGFGAIRTEKGDKVFSVKFDTDFNVIQNPIIYFENDTIEYFYNYVITNNNNEFVLLIYDRRNKIMLLDSNGYVIKHQPLDAIAFCTTIEQFQGNYIVDLSRKFYIIDKDSLSVIDSVEMDIDSYYPDGNLLKLNDSTFIRSNEFRNYPLESLDLDRSVVFYNKNFEVTNKIELGKRDYFDDLAYFNMDFTTQDSIFYVYSTRLSDPLIPVSESATSVSVACFSETGEKYFDYQFTIKSDSNSIKRIYGILATKDGGCLVNGISVRYATEEDSGQFKGFLLKYNPQWYKASIPEIPATFEIIIYPNPAYNQIIIDNKNFVIRNLIIYNIMGKEIGCSAINATKTNLDVSNLPAGMYVVKINTEQGIVTKKVQIIR